MIKFHPLPSKDVANIRATGQDSNGQPLETAISNGDGILCRHCLKNVPEGDAYLVLGYRPFQGLNPYTETGPLFLCAQDCSAAKPSKEVPSALGAPDFIVRGYDQTERIIYGTGRVTPTEQITTYAQSLLARAEVAFVDIRSARNNCFQCRILRG